MWDSRLHHWIGIWSHWLHLNLVPTRLCVFSKCFWVVSWSHCSHLNSLDKACVAKVLDQKMFFSINRNHQDEITFNKISTYWAPLLEHLFQCFLITLVTFIFDSFMLIWFMWGEIWCLNCFILTLFTFIFKHTMLGLCAFTRVCWNPFITLVTFICNPVWLLCLVVHYTLIKLACPADLISQLYAINYFC